MPQIASATVTRTLSEYLRSAALDLGGFDDVPVVELMNTAADEIDRLELIVMKLYRNQERLVEMHNQLAVALMTTTRMENAH